MNKDITEIDKNLKPVELSKGLQFYDVHDTKARIYGCADGAEGFCRLPESLYNNMSDGLRYLQTNTSGVRVRFTASGTRLGIRLRVSNTDAFAHMPYSGYAGIDCFANDGTEESWLGARWPQLGSDMIETEFALPKSPSLITLYLPLYSGVKELKLGALPSAQISKPALYDNELPVVFYGSSITQGGCASRASNSYPAVVCRWLGCNFVNLGFSGNAFGEQWLAEYIASLPMRAFVYDYDHNAPSLEHLLKTHLPFLNTVLSKQPKLPIIFMSKPNPDLSSADYERREIIKQSFNNVVANGATAAFIDGNSLFYEPGRECCTVDGVHPNDLGFYRMAESVLEKLKAML